MRWAAGWVLLFLGSAAQAHQPVMDMAPRWDGGYGFQTRVEQFDDVTTTWLEGVYTWDRSIRSTFKLPYHDGELGYLVLALPLKNYFNEGPRTGNWSLTPQVQLPTGKDGEWDAGVSFSFSAESTSFYQLYDLYSWGDRTGLDINVGFAFPRQGAGLYTLWDLSLLESDEGDRVQTGPVFVYFHRNVILRAEYKHLVYERDSDWDGGLFNLGIGWVF